MEGCFPFAPFPPCPPPPWPRYPLPPAAVPPGPPGQGDMLAGLPGGGVDGRIVAGVVVGIGVVAQLVAGAFVPPIAGETDGEVRRTAQRHFFLRVALAEPGALLGFMGFVLSGNPAVYLAGAIVSIAGLVDAAPGQRWIERGQDQLRDAGSPVDLMDALLGGGVTR